MSPWVDHLPVRRVTPPMGRRRRVIVGLQVAGSYTLAKSMDTNSGDGTMSEQDSFNLADSYALSDFDVRHRVSFNVSYDLPFKGAVLGNWRVNWVASFYSGQAQTISCTPATGSGTGCYALVVGDPYAGANDVNNFYNAAAFANPAPVATIGQTDFSPLGGPRSQVTGPPMRQLDAGVARQFGLWGQSKAEFRLEVFNVTNTPSFNLPGSLNFGDARNFASITSMRNTPRQMQVGVQFYW